MRCTGSSYTNAQIGSVDASLLRAQGRLLASGIVVSSAGYRFAEPLASAEGIGTQGVAIEDALLGSGNVVLDASTPAPDVRALTALVASAPQDGTALLNTVTVDGAPERALARKVELPRGAGQATLVLTLSLAATDDTLQRTATFLIVAVATIALTAGFTGYWIAGRVLRPVARSPAWHAT